ncbi:MAG: ATP-binding protein [Kiritimatiellia bacterium]
MNTPARSKPARIHKALLNSMPKGVAASDRRGLLIYMNHTAETLTGAKFRTHKGKSVRQVIRIADVERRSPEKLPSARSFRRDRSPRVFPRCILCASGGKETFVSLSAVPVQEPDGSVVGAMYVFEDIAANIEKEQRMLEEHKIEAVGNIAGGIAHDYSKRLSAISGMAAGIAENVIPNTHIHEAAVKIMKAVEQSAVLSRRLMTAAGITAGHTETGIGPAPLRKTVNEAISLVEGAFEDKQVTFNAKMPLNTPYVIADRAQLLDSLVNLFQNSADSMPRGGTITIDGTTRKKRNDPVFVLRVRDTGTGIHKDRLERIFEPFYTTKERHGAMGLGLTMVRSCVRRWGGSIKVHSRKNQGTSIRLFLPLSAEQPETEIAHARRGRKELILVADDSSATLEETASILNSAGYRLQKAGGSDDALSMYKRQSGNINLCIVDAVMPASGGKKIVEGIQRLNPVASILVMSGFSRDFLRDFLPAGAWYYIQKPFMADTLCDAVARILKENSTSDTTSVTSPARSRSPRSGKIGKTGGK